jgi:hypothetical protein
MTELTVAFRNFANAPKNLANCRSCFSRTSRVSTYHFRTRQHLHYLRRNNIKNNSNNFVPNPVLYAVIFLHPKLNFPTRPVSNNLHQSMVSRTPSNPIHASFSGYFLHFVLPLVPILGSYPPLHSVSWQSFHGSNPQQQDHEKDMG